MFFMKQIYHVLWVAVLSVVLFGASAFGAILSVPSAEYPTIQAAIDAAVDGDEVEVANSLVPYTGTGNRDIDFKGKEIIVRSTPEIIGDETVYHPELCIIDCQGNGRGVTFSSGEGENSRFIGFTLQNGSAGTGAGINIQASSPEILNCIIQQNRATALGGGIYCQSDSTVSSRAKIIDCIIKENYANSSGGGIAMASESYVLIVDCEITKNTAANGGGIYLYDHCSPIISGTNISHNTSLGTSEKLGGGGIYISTQSDPTITNGCKISYNTTGNAGGGIAAFYTSSFTLNNSDVFANTAKYGGGIYSDGYSTNLTGRMEIIKCRIYSNEAAEIAGGMFSSYGGPYIENTVIANNQSGSAGSGVYALNGNDMLEINSCTIADNFSIQAGASDYGLYCIASDVTVLNSIIWGHNAGSIRSTTGSVSITYSDTQEAMAGTGNVSVNPMFIDEAYHFSEGSPLSSLTGTHTGAPTNDLYGNVRPNPPHMGAYEFMPIPGFDESLELVLSGDDGSSSIPGGTITRGYDLTLNAGVGYHLDVNANGSPTTTQLKKGVYPFYLSGVSDIDEFFAYWDSQDLLIDKCSPEYRLFQSVNVSRPLYSHDFGTNPNYTPQNISVADDLHWDKNNQWFDAKLYDTNADNQKFVMSNSFQTVQDASFTLQYDCFIDYIGYQTGIELGLGIAPADGSTDLHVRAYRSSSGFQFFITDGNGNTTVTGTGESDKWYHVVIAYDYNSQTADLTITDRATGAEFFSQEDVVFNAVAFDRVWIGDHTVGGTYYARAFFDNILITASNQMPAFYVQADENGNVRLVDGPRRDVSSDVSSCQVPDGGIHDTVEILGGDLNNTPLSTCMSEITVFPGETIAGEVKIYVNNTNDNSNVFPVGWCQSWTDNNQFGYTEIVNKAPVGISKNNVYLETKAPVDIGTYYIIFAGCDGVYGNDNLFAKLCGTGAPSAADWNDRNDIADLGESAYCTSNWQHWLDLTDGASCLEPGIAMIKVNVVESGSLEAFVIPADYPQLTYTYEGQLEGENGITSENIQLILNVEGISLDIDAMDLIMTTDPDADVSTWSTLAGNIANGYGLGLDPAADYHYLDIKSGSVQTTGDAELIPGTYGFNLAGETGDPAFYLEITKPADQFEFHLYDTADKLNPFMVDGNHTPGEYVYTGQIDLTEGGHSDLDIRLNMTSKAPELTASYIIDIEAGQQYSLVPESSSDLAPGAYPFYLKMTPDGAATGTDPAFYLSVDNAGAITLVQNDQTTPWQISGDSAFGNYLYTGTVTGSNGMESGEQYLVVQLRDPATVIDPNNDGKIELKDAVIILQKLVNIRQ